MLLIEKLILTVIRRSRDVLCRWNQPNVRRNSGALIGEAVDFKQEEVHCEL